MRLTLHHGGCYQNSLSWNTTYNTYPHNMYKTYYFTSNVTIAIHCISSFSR